MKTALKAVSFASLALLFVAAGLLFAGVLPRGAYGLILLAGTVGWFATVPFWMKRRLHHSEDGS